MYISSHIPFVFVAICIASLCHAQKPAASCSSSLPAISATPTAASDYVVRLVATGLSDPRGIKFDSEGALLVVESGSGIIALNFDDQGGDCLSVQSQKTVISDSTLNHGIELSSDGKTLYASNPEAV